MLQRRYENSGNCEFKDKILLLWKAAVKLEGEDIDKMIQQNSRSKRTNEHSSIKRSARTLSPVMSVVKTKSSMDRIAIRSKNSHNEIERSRRAHLRMCMDELKKKLVFNSDFTFSRITMLSVLKKAVFTIKTKEKSIRLLYNEESEAKNKNAQLKQKMNNLERQITVLYNQISTSSLQSQEDKRIRNYSECSIITTSSEDSLQENPNSFTMNQPINYGLFSKQQISLKPLPLFQYPNSDGFGTRSIITNAKLNKKAIKPLYMSTPIGLQAHPNCYSPSTSISTGSDSGIDDFTQTIIDKSKNSNTSNLNNNNPNNNNTNNNNTNNNTNNNNNMQVPNPFFAIS